MHAAVLPTLADEGRRLATELPLPDDSHPWADDLRAVGEALARGVEIVRASPEAADALEELLAQTELPESVGGGGDRLAHAFERIASLPLPTPGHPHLDLIVPALESAVCVLAAIASVPEARAVY